MKRSILGTQNRKGEACDMTVRQQKVRIRWGRLAIVAAGLLLSAAAVFLAARLTVSIVRRGFFPAENAKQEVPQIAYHSAHDEDGDGFDDQLDLLMGVHAYLETEPQYESIYYEGGWPDDEHGVCTDVVAQGMLAAGYDLMELIDRDIREHPEAYPVETPDANIDFRRVRNQDVWLRRHAVMLTTDLDDTQAWQPGDVVVFGDTEHIGVLSDRLNANGIPYLLHNGSPLQVSYEENKLELLRDSITGHYRIS